MIIFKERKMNRWLFLAVSAMTLATFSLSAYCKSCGTRSDRGPRYYKNSGHNRHMGMKTYYTENSNYRDRKDDQYITNEDKKTLQEIHKTLNAQGFDWDNNNVQVLVEYGKVLFRGRVDSEGEKESLKKAAAQAPFVKNVVLDIYVDNINHAKPKQIMPANFQK